MMDLLPHPRFEVERFTETPLAANLGATSMPATLDHWLEWEAEFLHEVGLDRPLTVTPEDGPWVRCYGSLIHKEWIYERHHVRPVSWGGPSTTAIAMRGGVWVPVCGSCHTAIHLYLDTAMRRGVAPTRQWCIEHMIGYKRAQIARQGWNLHLAAIERGEVPVPAWWPEGHDTLRRLRRAS
jgi:hypothetical protein